MSTACSTCDAPIVFARTLHGSTMPLDAAPVLFDGNRRGLFVLVTSGDKTCCVALGTLLNAGLRLTADVRIHRTHYATCPQASQHRRST